MENWLSDEEEEAWRSWITATRQLYAHLGQEMHDEFGLSIGDYEILVRLSEGPEQRLRMSELAKLTLASRSRLSHQIDRMEKAGLVRREANPDDRRGLFAVLTPQGETALKEAAPFHVDGVRRNVFDILTKQELATVATVSRKVLAQLESS